MSAATVMRGYSLMPTGGIYPQEGQGHFKWKPTAGVPAASQWMELKQEAEPADFFSAWDLAPLLKQPDTQQQSSTGSHVPQAAAAAAAADSKSVLLDLQRPSASTGSPSPSHSSYLSTLTSKDHHHHHQHHHPGAVAPDARDVIIPKLEERVVVQQQQQQQQRQQQQLHQQQQADDLSSLLCSMGELIPPGLDPMAGFPPIVDHADQDPNAIDFDSFDVVAQFGLSSSASSRDEDMLLDVDDFSKFSDAAAAGVPSLRRSSTFPEYHHRPAAVPSLPGLPQYDDFPNFCRLLDTQFTDNFAFPQASNHIHPELAASVLRQVISDEQEPVPMQPQQERLVAPPEINGTFMQGQPLFEENLGLRLVHRLLSCAEAVYLDDPIVGNSILPRLLDDADPYGDPMQRIAVYFGEALRECLATKFPPNFMLNRQRQQQHQQQQQQQQGVVQQQQQQQEMLHSEHDQNMPGSSLDHDLAYQAMYQVLPFIKFSQFTANQAILDSVGKRDRIHIIDLDIKQGLQWPGLIQSLAVRQGGPPALKLTGVGLDSLVLAQTGRRLDEFAKSLNVPFHFEAVVEKVDNLHPLLFSLDGDEGLAVNCPSVMHRLLADEQAVDKVLRMVKNLQPAVVTLLEVEGNHNSSSFFDRFVAALHYYSAMFDSLEATLERDSTERLRIESLCLANEIRNILACDGADRTSRHVRMDLWRGFLHGAAFSPKALSEHALYQAKLLLGLYSSSSYKFTHDGYCATLGWHETPVVSVSAWCPAPPQMLPPQVT